MFTHSDIWRAIDRMAITFGFSASGLAKKAGLDPTTFNKSKRISADGKPRWPSTESLAKILAVTGMNMRDFFALTQDNDEDFRGDKKKPRGPSISLLGFAQAGRAGYFDEDGCPTGSGWDTVSFPPISHGKDSPVYALEVNGDFMAPLYREGDVVVVSPDENIRRGDRVVVRLKNGEVMAKEMVRQNAERVELRSINSSHDNLTLPRDDISWLGRIVWVSQ